MTKHIFKYYGFIDERKTWLITCKKTGGEFSSALWDKDLVRQNKCPCCDEIIKEKK